jgi:hypothetical protein
MSNSLAAAKKRRAPAQNTPQPEIRSTQSAPSQPTPQNGLTLQQVIAVVDKRLLMLETNMQTVMQKTPKTEAPEIPSNITEVLDEFNSRFETMAIEIENLKNIVLSLQTYTMDVNKMLLEDRVRILSSPTPPTPTIETA